MSETVASREDTIDQNYEEYNEQIKEFYTLKNRYETKIKDYKKSIRKLSLAEKKEKLANFKFKMKCINCEKRGGSIFSVSGNNLAVKCGNLSEPCNLNITIEKPQHYYIPEIIKETKNSIQEIKQLITIYKLDLLFEMEHEDVIITEFKSLKDDLDTQTQILKNFNIIDSVLNEQVSLDEVYIPEFVLEQKNEEIKDDISPEQFNRKRLLNELVKYANREIGEFKQLIVAYKNTEEFEALNGAIEKYKYIIKPTLESVRKLQYNVTYLEKEKISGGRKGTKLMPIYHFTPMKYNIDNKIYSHME
jgi:hypothetical protein